MNFNTLKSRVFALFNRPMIRNTLWMLMAQGLRLVLQAGYFVIIARALGAEQYGAFIGAAALVAICAPFASLGGGNLLIKNVSRNRDVFAEYWGNALVMILISGIGLTVVLLLVAPLFLPKTISPLLLFLVAMSDLIFTRILDTAGQAFQAVQVLSRTAQLSIVLMATKILAAIALVSFVPTPDALKWTFLYLASSVVAAILGVVLVHRELGSPQLALSRIKPELKEGFYFAISLSAQTVYNDIDKTMLARLSTLEATGIYAAAYRLIDVAFVPVRSILYAAYAKFFQQGERGISGSLNLAKRLAPLSGVYGIAAGIGVFVFAPVVPYILGDEYANAVEALRWLGPLLFLKAMHYFAADTLTGAGFQGLRSAIQTLIAIFNVVINFWIIPLYSWRGAAWSSLASDALLMVSLGLVVMFIYQQQTQNEKGNNG